MTPGAPLSYTAQTLDRATHLRTEAARLEAFLETPGRRVLPLWRNRHAVDAGRHALSLPGTGPWPRPSSGPAPDPWPTVFLGLASDGTPCFACDLSSLDEPPDLGGDWLDLREIGPLLPAEDAGLMGYARGVLGWHRRHGFCPVCGAATVSRQGGHLRLCTNADCATPQFPRSDPAVIMLVVDADDRVLLGRQAKWPPGMVSTLAGFVEPGETLEQAVAREVMEETGVVVSPRDVSYVASQPWPFPASLMLAFEARAETTAVTVDETELEAADWYDRATVATFRETLEPGDGPALPRPDSIARHLINRWLRR